MNKTTLLRTMCLLGILCFMNTGKANARQYLSQGGIAAAPTATNNTFCLGAGVGSTTFSHAFTTCTNTSSGSPITYTVTWQVYSGSSVVSFVNQYTTSASFSCGTASPITLPATGTISVTTLIGSLPTGDYAIKVKYQAITSTGAGTSCSGGGSSTPVSTTAIAANISAACSLRVVDPTVTIAAASDHYCPSATSGITLTATPTSVGGTPVWSDPPSGSHIGSGLAVDATTGVSGAFGVTYSFSTATGSCSSSATSMLYAPTAYTVSPLGTTSTVCTGYYTTLSPGVSGGSDFTYPENTVTAGSLATPTNVASGGLGILVDASGSGDMDNGFVTVPMGFDFNFYGVRYNSVTISANGYVNFGAPTTSIPASLLPDPLEAGAQIALFAHDMDASTTGDIGYVTGGTSPNRYIIIAYNNVPDAGGSGSNSGQIVINEGGTVNMLVTAGTYTGNQGVQNLYGTSGYTVPTRDFTSSFYVVSSTEEREFTFTTLPSILTYGWSILSGPGSYTTGATYTGSPATTAILTTLGPTDYEVSVADEFGCPSTGHTVITASDFTWTSSAADGDWHNGANWACGSVPAVTDNAIVPQVGSAIYPTISAAATAHNLTIGNSSATAPASVILAASQTLTLANDLTIIANPIAVGYNQLSMGASSIVTVAGNLENGGTITGAGVVSLNGSSAQTVKSTRHSSASVGTKNITNLDLSNTSGGVTVLNASGAADSTGITTSLTFGTACTLTTGNYLKLRSSSGLTARIGALPSGASISGGTSVEQYIPGGRRAYRFIGHPFDADLAGGLTQIESGVDITGVGSAPSGFSNCFTYTPTHDASAKRYFTTWANSGALSDPGWDSFRTGCGGYADGLMNDFAQHQGIRLAVRGVPGQGLNGLPYTPSPTTYTIYGHVNTGDQNVALVFSSTTSVSAFTSASGTVTSGTTQYCQTYNMIGNPYASPVDIATVCRRNYTAGTSSYTGTAGTGYYGTSASLLYTNFLYVWRPYMGTAGQYEPINFATTTHFNIAGNTAYQVRTNPNCTSPGPLVFHESDKATSIDAGHAPTSITPGSGQALLRGTQEPQYTMININGPDGNLWDKVGVAFNDAATDKEDEAFDAGKLMGFDYNFFSIGADGQPLSYDNRPFADGKIIPLGMSAKEGTHLTLSVQSVALADGNALYLHDKMLDKYVLLQQGMEYPFEMPVASTASMDRFELAMRHVGITDANKDGKITASLSPNPATQLVNVAFACTSTDKVGIRVMDVTGTTVLTYDAGVTQSGSVSLDIQSLASGIYMVEVASGINKVVQRLVKE